MEKDSVQVATFHTQVSLFDHARNFIVTVSRTELLVSFCIAFFLILVVEESRTPEERDFVSPWFEIIMLFVICFRIAFC